MSDHESSRWAHPDPQTHLHLLQAAVDQAGEAIILLEDQPRGAGRRVVYANRAFTEMTGYTSDEIEGNTLYILKGEGTEQAALDRIATAMEAGTTVTERLLNYRNDGTTFWAECTLAPVTALANQRYWVSIQRDITEVMSAEDRLRRSESRYQALLEHYPLGAIVLFDHDLRYLLAGGQELEDVGLSADDMVGKTIWDVFPHETARAIEPDYRRALNGEHGSSEVPFRGQTYLMHAVPVRADDGTVTAGLVVTVNVTQQKEAEAALRESEARFRLVAENMRDLVCLQEPDGTYLWLSPSFEQVLGYQTDELIGATPYTLYHPDEVERLWQEAHRPILTGDVADNRVTHRLRRKDGSYVWVETVTKSVCDDDGTVVQLQSTSRDVTERKQFEDALIRAKEQAERVSRLKSAFLANMSHEIRTPLTNVIGFTELLVDTVNDEQRSFVELIREGSTRLLNTLNSVLDLAQLESQTIHLRVERVDVCEVVRDTTRFFQAEAERRGLTLRHEVVDAPLRAVLDPTALGRILNNLVSNALKFTREGSVVVTLAEQGDRVQLQVKDTGVGINARSLDRIFDPFEQESTGFGRTFEGVGLGLSITRHLVELMGGSIDVTSTKGRGSTFSVTLPRHGHRHDASDGVHSTA